MASEPPVVAIVVLAIPSGRDISVKIGTVLKVNPDNTFVAGNLTSALRRYSNWPDSVP